MRRYGLSSVGEATEAPEFSCVCALKLFPPLQEYSTRQRLQQLTANAFAQEHWSGAGRFTRNARRARINPTAVHIYFRRQLVAMLTNICALEIWCGSMPRRPKKTSVIALVLLDLGPSAHAVSRFNCAQASKAKRGIVLDILELDLYSCACMGSWTCEMGMSIPRSGPFGLCSVLVSVVLGMQMLGSRSHARRLGHKWSSASSV